MKHGGDLHFTWRMPTDSMLTGIRQIGNSPKDVVSVLTWESSREREGRLVRQSMKTVTPPHNFLLVRYSCSLEKGLPAPFIQLLGVGCLILCEALHLFPWMQWGPGHSIGHYLDLGRAVLGVTLFPAGHLLHACKAGRLMCSPEPEPAST
jgi:hypothetical protein